MIKMVYFAVTKVRPFDNLRTNNHKNNDNTFLTQSRKATYVFDIFSFRLPAITMIEFSKDMMYWDSPRDNIDGLNEMYLKLS